MRARACGMKVKAPPSIVGDVCAVNFQTRSTSLQASHKGFRIY